MPHRGPIEEIEELEEELIEAVEAELPELLSPPVLKRILQILHFISIFISLLGIILISVSLNHDSRWNTWVDGRFNLNHKNSQFRIHMDDYVDVHSQQHWITLLSRDLSLDQFYLLLTITAVVITVFHFIFGDIRAAMIGAMIFTVCCAIVIVAATFVIISLRVVYNTEDQVAAMIQHVRIKKNMTGSLDDGRLSLLAASEDFSVDLQSSISCRISDNDHNPEVKHHCQLFTVKIMAILAGFFNAAIYIALIALFVLKGTCRRKEVTPEARNNRTPPNLNRNSAPRRDRSGEGRPRRKSYPKKHRKRQNSVSEQNNNNSATPKESRRHSDYKSPPEDVDIGHDHEASAIQSRQQLRNKFKPIDAFDLEEEFRQSIAIRLTPEQEKSRQAISRHEISRRESASGYQPHIQGSSWHIVN